MGFNIYQLRQEIQALLCEHPELAEDVVARLDTLEGATDLKEALAWLLSIYQDATALLEGLQSHMKKLQAREARIAMRGYYINDLMLKVLQSADLRKVELPEATLSLKKNSPALVGNADPQSLPDDLVKITRAVDRTKVRDALKDGRAVEGFALSNSPPSLVVRVK